MTGQCSRPPGAGSFCGVQLQIWNPRGGWWGEGDEKFFVDGEKFPSTYRNRFGRLLRVCLERSGPVRELPIIIKPSAKVTRDTSPSIGGTFVDNVPFQTSFEATIEKYYAKTNAPRSTPAVAYWYQAGGDDLYKPVPVNDRVDYYAGLSFPMDIDGMNVLEKPVGEVIEEQHMGAFKADKWQNDRQLWWVGQVGAKLKIGLDIEEKGTYTLTTRLTKASDYGIVQFYLDDEKVLEPMDMYYPDGVIATKPITLGKFKLDKGQHILSVEIVGSNPNAIKRYMVGIDYVNIN